MISLWLKVMLVFETVMVLVFSKVYLVHLISHVMECVEFCTSMILLYVDLLSRLKLDSVGKKNHENMPVACFASYSNNLPLSKILAESDHGP